MAREVRYCTTEDGVRIAYSVEGEGPPLFLVHWVYSFSLSHTVPTFDAAIRRLGQGRRLIRYDMRGTGLSQRNVDDLSFDACTRDIDAVVSALDLRRFTMLGAAVGGARAIEYAAFHPDRVSALILYETFPRLLDAFPRQVLDAFVQLARADWRLATRTFVDAGVRRQNEQEGLRWAEMLESSITGETLARLMETQAELDVSELLPSIQCPTLVCHSRNDPLWPLEFGMRMAEAIPDARFAPLEGDSGGPFTEPESALEAMEAFLSEVQPAATAVATPQVVLAKPLTPRETEVLKLMATGLTSKEISSELSLSVRTVGRHITNIYDKIGTRSRAAATAFALRHGIARE